MLSMTFDTYQLIKELKQSGFNEIQAEGLSSAFKEIQTTQLENLATKSDIKELRLEIQRFESAVKADSQRLESEVKTDLKEVKADLQRLESELKGDLQKLESELKADLKENKNDLKSVESELKGDLKRVESELKGDLKRLESELKSDFKLIKWVLALIVTVILLPTLKELL